MGNFLDVMQLFLDLVNGLRVCLFDPLRQPKTLDGVQPDDDKKDDEEQHDPDLLKVADDRRDGPAKEVARTRQNQDPDKTANEIEEQKTWEGHSPNTIENAHRGPYSVDVFRYYDRERTEFVDEFFDPRLGHLIEAVMLCVFVKDAAYAVGDVVAGHPAQRTEKQHLGKAVLAEKSALCHRPRDQEGDVPFDHTESENRVNTIFRDYV